MEKILIIDSNNHVSELIKNKIEEKLDFEVFIRNNKSEAKDLIHKNQFFISISSFNNIGEKKGESLEYSLNKHIPTIVLMNKINKKNMKKIKEYNIVDYVAKEKLEDIAYLIYLVERLYKNRFYKALIVADSRIQRAKISYLLSNQLINTKETDEPYDCIKLLQEDENIKILFIDYKLHDINGIHLVEQIRKIKPKEQLLIVAIPEHSKEREQLPSQFLKIGANDYLRSQVTKEEFNSRINNLFESFENMEKMKDFAYKDFLTNLYNRRYFFREMNLYVNKNEGSEFSTSMIDIDFFKKVNDTYGHDAGDKVIKTLSNILMKNTKNSDLVSRFGGEEFCITLKNISEEDNKTLLEKIRKEVEETTVSFNNQNINFTISIGTVITNDRLVGDINETIKIADNNLYEAKNNGRNKIVSSLFN